MPYDEDLADRIRELVAKEKGLTEQKMFGGLAFLIGGNMAVAASGQGGILVRVDPAAVGQARLDHEGRNPMVMRGRAMDGWLRVDAEDVRRSVSSRVGETRRHLRSLPAREVLTARRWATTSPDRCASGDPGPLESEGLIPDDRHPSCGLDGSDRPFERRNAPRVAHRADVLHVERHAIEEVVLGVPLHSRYPWTASEPLYVAPA